MIATRNGGSITYHTQTHGTTVIAEDSGQVDGIGGVLWDGTLVMNFFLEMLLTNRVGGEPQTLHILELGAGAGLTVLMLRDLAKSSSLSSSVRIKLTATDRCVDLLLQNSAHSVATGAADLQIMELEWGREEDILRVLRERGKADVIIGSEIMVLVKQQPALLDTIDRLRHEDTLLFMSADGGLQEGPVRARRCEYTASKYEAAFTDAMLQRGLASNPVCQGTVRWQGSKAMLEGGQCLTVCHLLASLAAAQSARADCKPQESSSRAEGRKHGGPPHPPLADDKGDAKCSELDSPPPPQAKQHQQQYDLLDTHHIVMYYPLHAVSTCKRCQVPYLSTYGGMFNPTTACAYHPLSFVCRKHPCEVGLDGGFGDGEGYYGGGQQDYAAKFWDCCGSEDFLSPGCQRQRHEGY